MSQIWLPEGARPPRATLPEGDVTLANGLLLVHDGEASISFLDGAAAALQPMAAAAVYRSRVGLLVIASIDQTRKWGPLLHVTMSYKDRNPSWREIRLIKDAFYGTARDAMMVLPREPDYVNVHRHCFHLWETPESWGMQ